MSQHSMRIASSATLVAFLALGVLPLPGFAQVGTFFTPAKRLNNGTMTTPIAGKGSVTIKVFIRANGTPDTKQIVVVKSTNPGDNATAMEVAATAKYKPAARDAKPTASFYTFTINFTAGGSNDVSDGTTNATLSKILAMERANNFSGAKAQLGDYLKTSPGDKRANELLGVADSYTSDPLGAAAAFDKAGTISATYRNVALQAYIEAAGASLKAGTFDASIAQAGKAIELGAGAEAYNVRGSAEYGAKNFAAAVPDLEKARDLARTAKASNHQIAIIETNLASAYLADGHVEKGLATAKDVAQLDPSVTAIQDALATYYSEKAQAASKSADRADAVALYESGAAAAPKYAVSFFASAANVLASDPKPDWKKVKAEADKALAVNPNDARANFIAGIALANDKNPKDALTYLNKAQAAAKDGSDATLSSLIADAIKKLSPPK